MKTARGYILIMTLLILTLATTLVTLLVTRGAIFTPYMNVSVKREQAKQLAMGGVFIAGAQLCQPAPKEQESGGQGDKGAQKQSADQKEIQHFLKNVLPLLNQWQEVALTEVRDGIDGQIKICIMSEEGKINLNAIYDYRKHQFIGEPDKKQIAAKKAQTQQDQNGDDISGNWKAIMEDVCSRIEKQTGAQKLFPALESFLKSRKQPLRDVTELLAIKEFSVFRDAIFYDPAGQITQDKKKPPLYLTDLFTVIGQDKMHGLFLSPSIRTVYDLGWQMPRNPREVEPWLDGVLKKCQLEGDWKSQWNSCLKPLYGKELQSLPKYIESLIRTWFWPRTFAILVQGSVGGVTQRVLAFIYRYEIDRSLKKKGDQARYGVKVGKLCWL